MTKVFAIWDQAAAAYLPPFFLATKGMALRGFMDAIADPRSQFAQHPADYTLFELGEFDEADGSFKCTKVPVKIASALELKSVDKEPQGSDKAA